MNWKLKALVHKGIAALPGPLSVRVNYLLQRRFGALRNTNPISRLVAGANVVRYVEEHGSTMASKTCLEVGTGQQIALPIALWLCGASKVITVDINPYLCEELVLNDVKFIRENQIKVMEIFQTTRSFEIVKSRLVELVSAGDSFDKLCRTIGVHYLCPMDAAALPLEDNSVDFHVSYTVLEHIPRAVLKGILVEGRRILRSDGLFVHCVDYSDHFSHADDSISSINFLRYDDRTWAFLAANRYAYHNRMRVDEYMQLFEKCGLKILKCDIIVDEHAVALLKKGLLDINESFKSKPIEVNAARHSWIVAVAHTMD